MGGIDVYQCILSSFALRDSEASTGFHLKRQTQWYRNCTTLPLSVQAFYIQGTGYTVFLVDRASIQRTKNSTRWAEGYHMFGITYRHQHILLRECTKSLGTLTDMDLTMNDRPSVIFVFNSGHNLKW